VDAQTDRNHFLVAACIIAFGVTALMIAH